MTTPEKPQDDAQRILDAVRRIVRELRVSARAAEAKVGLSGAQLFVLSRLAEARGLSLGELAERTLTDPSSVSVVVRRLTEAGLATRKRSPEDERRVELAITPAGRALLRKAPAAAQERLVVAIAKLGPTKKHTLATLLDTVVQSMGISSTEPRLFFEEEAAGSKKKTTRRAAPERRAQPLAAKRKIKARTHGTR